MGYRFKIIEYISQPSDGQENEDGVIIKQKSIAVLDGATPTRKIAYQGFSNLASWLVNVLKERFLMENSGDFIMDLKRSFGYIVEKFPLTDIEDNKKPTLTISAATIVNDLLCCYGLGDCSVFVKLRTDGEIKKLYDDRVDPYSRKTYDCYIDNLKMSDDLHNVVVRQKEINMLSRNKPNGFWVVGYSGDFYKEILTMNINVSIVDKVLLCTDGFSRLIDSHEVDIGDILSGRISLQEAYSILRRYENDNYLSPDFGYVKPHDDVTAIIACIEEKNA